MAGKTLYIPDEAFGITQEQAQAKIATGKSRKWAHFTPTFVGTQIQTLDLDVLKEQIEASQRLYQDARVGQSSGLVRIGANLPILIYFIGDCHFGSIYTDHQELERQFGLIENTPLTYVIFMANLIDNAIPAQYPNNMLVNAIPPDKQVIAMRKRIEQLAAKGKVLGAVTSPCHEGWTFRHTGQDINALIFGFKKRRFPVLDNGSMLTLKMRKVLYNIALYHMVGPFESNFNETHALRQMNRLNLLMEADVVVGAHKHFAAAETVFEGFGEIRKVVAYIRSGTYKGISEIHDQFPIQRYGVTGEPTGQAVILWPNEKRIEAFLEFDTALAIHQAIALSALAENDY